MEAPPNAIARLALCRGQKYQTMNQIATAPQTVDQIRKLPNTIYAKSHAQAYAAAGERLPYTDGPIVSKKLFAEENKVVYEYYRVRNKEEKIYVIF